MPNKKRNNHGNNNQLISQKKAIEKYGVNKRIIDTYFPKPVVKYYGNYKYVRLWDTTEIEKIISEPEVKKLIDENRMSRQRDRDLEKARDLLQTYTPEKLIEKGKSLKRVFVLHVGPTNSGKTYEAVKALKNSGCGTYLGPLRLLALEMFDRMNSDGVSCSLLTGEESITKEDAGIISSTIELCNFNRHFKVAVIDEAQMITDNDRGSSWLRAICCVDAEEVHICLAPEARAYIESLISQFGDPYSVVEHKRLVPLVYSGICGGFTDIKPGDAIICFSRKSVLSTAAHLERNGFRASVIYGALPPIARRNEVSRYLSGETNVIVATDAIGMGISLPIRRVVFAETQKFDGKEQRYLYGSEVRQIAGRAGRYGMFELGEVLSMNDDSIVSDGLKNRTINIKTPCIEFPRETLNTELSLDVLLKAWQTLPRNKSFKREDMSSALALHTMLRDDAKNANRELLFDLITCPIDSDNRDLAFYWLRCSRNILRNRRIPDPDFSTDTLLGCELQYKAWDINHQLKLRIGIQDDNFEQREEICRKIREFMTDDKEKYIRKCENCGCELPIGYTFKLCGKCYNSSARSWKY